MALVAKFLFLTQLLLNFPSQCLPHALESNCNFPQVLSNLISIWIHGIWNRHNLKFHLSFFYSLYVFSVHSTNLNTALQEVKEKFYADTNSTISSAPEEFLHQTVERFFFLHRSVVLSKNHLSLSPISKISKSLNIFFSSSSWFVRFFFFFVIFFFLHRLTE